MYCFSGVYIDFFDFLISEIIKTIGVCRVFQVYPYLSLCPKFVMQFMDWNGFII